MTDNEIIKALECCSGLDGCKECPAKEYNLECSDVLKFNALKLINRQKAEIERLYTTDVVPVVRCKECKHLEITGCYGECSKGYLGIVRPECYCCYGEKRNS